ncbi:hypothetical protein MKLM6_0216 [Methylomonas koyamae]|nr:polysaccharide pyruvyl transferase family protein [Methylomonas koyamae]ATG88499.1 hypothetical protein MKLM6_0216 [Methylomonas koyamae]
MRIGIMTYHFSDNYGALFQAYALREWFLAQGYDAQFVNYHPEHVEGGGNFELGNFFSKKNLKVLYLRFSKLKTKFFGNRQQKKNFEEFRSNYLGVNGAEYKDISDLESASLEFDLLVCGSDQIWNPSDQFGLDPVYFLNFEIKNKNVRRISYAPSFGRDEISAKYHNQLIKMIKKLDGVSARELSGVSIITNLADIEVSCVPDPTFLLNDYSKVMTPYPLKVGRYVFCYALRSRAVIGEATEMIADNLGASIYSPYNSHRRWREIGETVYPCPRQWLYLMENSDFVVTNSFHGTALSILLNKPFIVVGLREGKSSLNARALNLLEAVGLRSRFIDNSTQEIIDEILNSPIDWRMVNANICNLRMQGEAYLNDQLSKMKGDIDG